MKKILIVGVMLTAIALVATGAALFGLAKSPTETQLSDDNTWALIVTGSVRDKVNLSLSDILAMPQTTFYSDIYCVDYPQAPVLDGDWTGVRLGPILENAGILPSAIKVAFYARDGYATDLTIDGAMAENVIVAYELDNNPLSALRLVVPGQWGYKWVNGLNLIRLFDSDFKGKWESMGYPDNAVISG